MLTATAWAQNTINYTFNSATGALTLISGDFNKYNKWGEDVTPSAVKSVTATSNVSFTGDCSSLFSGFFNCESMDLSRVTTSGMTNAHGMFYECLGLPLLDLSCWDTANVTDMEGMFYACCGLTSLNLSGWDTENVTCMSEMFRLCVSLTSLDLSGFNTENVTDMSCMFFDCSGLTILDVTNFNTKKVTKMNCMFGDCFSLNNLDITGFITDNVKDMSAMFIECKGLTSLDLSGFNTQNVTEMNSMFSECNNITTIYAGPDWSTGKVIDADDMFYKCTSLVGGMGTTYDANHTDKTYARIDGGVSNPGYFTAKAATQTGDVNGDNFVTISDVTALIDALLSQDMTSVNQLNADVNGDNQITIGDVTALIDMLLSRSGE